jgi:large subunit ribosomal protein L32
VVAYDEPFALLQQVISLELGPEFRRLAFWWLAMAVPKRKSSNSRSGSRSANKALKPMKLEYCPQCSTAIPSHRVCPNCGHYMGRAMVEMAEE